MSLYSEMTLEELRNEMKALQHSGQKAFDEKNWSEYEIHMTKWYLAKSYEILPTAPIQIGRTYRLAEEYDRFTVTGIEGIMAWGIRESSAETEAVPIARLEASDADFSSSSQSE